jgi:hypothetical protein
LNSDLELASTQNFSHSKEPEVDLAPAVRDVRRISRELGKPVALLGGFEKRAEEDLRDGRLILVFLCLCFDGGLSFRTPSSFIFHSGSVDPDLDLRTV